MAGILIDAGGFLWRVQAGEARRINNTRHPFAGAISNEITFAFLTALALEQFLSYSVVLK